ncbi:UNVERIFIED_CONTAM: hypothetical protein K2H54_055130 [Gekko kuhli]
MDLDMRSHWVVSMDLSTPTNSKSLANELREADYPLAPQPLTSASNGTLMELEESTPPPIAPAPTKLGLEPDCSRESSLTPSAQDGPEDPLLPLPHVNGNLDNSTEDTLLLSFGTLSAQEQLDIIERLELTKNRLLSLRRNNPHGPPCDQTGLRNSSDSDRGGIRPSPPTQDMLDSRPLPGPNNEILAATDAPEVAARISGSPQGWVLSRLKSFQYRFPIGVSSCNCNLLCFDSIPLDQDRHFSNEVWILTGLRGALRFRVPLVVRKGPSHFRRHHRNLHPGSCSFVLRLRGLLFLRVSIRPLVSRWIEGSGSIWELPSPCA